MPPLPAVAGVLKAQMKWTATSAPGAYSHLYMHTTTSSVTQAQMNALATLIRTSWGTNMKTTQHQNWSLSQVLVEDLGPTPDVPGIDTTAVAGTLTLTPVTAETAMLCNMVIGRRYKGGHPRLYLPLGSSAMINDLTHWTSAFVSSCITGWAAHIAAILAGGSGTPTLDYMCSVSYHSSNALRPTPLIDKVLAYNFSQIPASQRRRMGR